MNSKELRSVIAVGATARPKRVAFIVDPSSVKTGEIDELTYGCSIHWGGGYWPIVPSDGNEISDDWWDILEAVDPDLVFHVPALSESLEVRIHRHLAPAKLTRITPDRKTGGLHIGLGVISALDSYDTLAYRAARYLPRPLRFLAVEDSAQPAPDRAFILRNFGLLRSTIQTEASFRSVTTDVSKVHDLSQSDVLEWFLALYDKPVVPRDLGILSAPRPFDTEHDQPFAGFTLIVGDSVDELLFAWNRALLSSGNLGRDALWIGSASARNSAFIELIAKWIQRYFWNNQQMYGGTVLSYTEDLAFLQTLADGLRKPTFMSWKGVRLGTGAFRARIRRSWGPVYEFLESPPRIVENVPVAMQGYLTPSGLVSVPRPAFISGTPGPVEAGWMIDLDVEYTLEPPRYANASDRWRLPRVASLGDLFAPESELSRIQRQHKPSASIKANQSALRLSIPSKAAVFERLLAPLPVSRWTTTQAGWPAPKYDFQASEQGSRFRGLVDLLGGVTLAGGLLDDLFWRTVLLEAIGKPRDEVDRLAEIVRREITRLVEAFAALPTDKSVEDRLTQLRFDEVARRVGSSLHQVVAQPRTLTRKALEQRYSQLATETIEDERGTRKLQFSDDALYDFDWLRETGALLQGVVVKCRHCGTKQWRAVDDIAPMLRCRDCTAEFPLPADPPWEYQVNSLIRNAITRDGLLPVIHAVWKLTSFARAIALTIAPQELREDPDGPKVTDLDIIIIRDGEFILGEVKSSPTKFDAEQMRVLETVVKEIRPNRFVLAAPGKEWPPGISQRFQEFKDALAPFDVKVEVLLLEW